MHCSRPALPIALLVAAIGLAAIATLAEPRAAHAEMPVIYKWVDENGVAHYTTDRERIPSAIRDRVLQGGEASRGADWLRRDADAPGASPAPLAPNASVPAAAPRAREADGVELPEDSDGVHAVEARPDWSQAPGGEASWAPGDLGEGGQAPVPPDARPRTTMGSPPVESTATSSVSDPAPPPPPPPPPLEADGAPIATRAPAPEDEAAGAAPELDAPAAGEPEVASDDPPSEPSAPAAVAAPAPRNLAPDEQAELAALDAQIAEVEAKIARDEEALMVLISENEAAQHDALVDDPQFRDIAQRLPKLQADLERLRERRAQIQPVVSRP